MNLINNKTDNVTIANGRDIVYSEIVAQTKTISEYDGTRLLIAGR